MALRISRKCHYALRAVFELAFRDSQEPVTVQEIASAQGIPPRFLETILNELRQAGMVVSQRGNAGGYLPARPASEITAGDVMEAIEGPIAIAPGSGDERAGAGYFCGDAALERLWARMNGSVAGVCRETTFEDMVAWERSSRRTLVPDYSI